MAFKMQDTEEFKLVTHRKKRVPYIRNSCDGNVPFPDDDDNSSDINTNYEALFGSEQR